MNHLPTFITIVILSMFSSCKEDDVMTVIDNSTVFEINEDSKYQDFLTPSYYITNNVELRSEINKFVHFVRIEDFQNPFQNSKGEISSYSVHRDFGDGIGMGGTSQHHPAIDLYSAENTDVSIYATHNGLVKTYRDSPKYRHYLTITKDVKDSENIVIGKLVSLYAHLDLDLDESESIDLNGMMVNKGDLVSKHLYSGTVGGAHLHLEIVYFRNYEPEEEEFYSWKNNDVYTVQSSGIWSYGYWNPNVGYGFGNPQNHGIKD